MCPCPMTGILPISKYSSGSELNMFMEFKMTSMEMFGEYFGFTDEEVDVLYDKYLHLCKIRRFQRWVTWSGMMDILLPPAGVSTIKICSDGAAVQSAVELLDKLRTL